jgi:hypothetical protein
MQDRDGALLVLNRRTRRFFCFFPFIKFIFADAGYQGQKTAAAIAKTGTWKLTIVQRNELQIEGAQKQSLALVLVALRTLAAKLAL